METVRRPTVLSTDKRTQVSTLLTAKPMNNVWSNEFARRTVSAARVYLNPAAAIAKGWVTVTRPSSIDIDRNGIVHAVGFVWIDDHHRFTGQHDHIRVWKIRIVVLTDQGVVVMHDI